MTNEEQMPDEPRLDSDRIDRFTWGEGDLILVEMPEDNGDAVD